jgi:four helix bundle protein
MDWARAVNKIRCIPMYFLRLSGHSSSYFSKMSEELEDRFLQFALEARKICFLLQNHTINYEYCRQLLRSSSSIGANYIEASDRLGKADETMKLKIARREAKESCFWLRLVYIPETTPDIETKRAILLDEAQQIKKILSAILLKRG